MHNKMIPVEELEARKWYRIGCDYMLFAWPSELATRIDWIRHGSLVFILSVGRDYIDDEFDPCRWFHVSSGELFGYITMFRRGCEELMTPAIEPKSL